MLFTACRVSALVGWYSGGLVFLSISKPFTLYLIRAFSPASGFIALPFA